MENIFLVLALGLGMSCQIHFCSGAVTAFGKVCGVGEEVCYGYICYNPKEKDCKTTVACPIGEEECHGNCFNASRQKCVSYVVGICDLTDEVCGTKCYDPTKLTCKHSPGRVIAEAVCKSSEEACGYRCYDPTERKCHPPDYFTTCRLGEHFCAYSNDCYDPTNKTISCVNGYLCPTEKKLVCGGTCYNSGEGICIRKGYSSVLCTQGWLRCQFKALGYLIDFYSFPFPR